MSRRWPLWLSLMLAQDHVTPAGREFPATEPTSAPPAAEPARRPLSWDAEDRAVAAGQCPWHRDLDFPDHAALLRHVVMHARTWEAEALHSERLRRAMVGRVAGFARDVVERANELGGGS